MRSATSTSPTPTRLRPDVRRDQEQGRQVRRRLASTGPPRPLAGATIKPDLTYNPLNAAGADAYPITAADLDHRLPEAARRRQAATTLKGWLNFLLTEGQALAADVDFAPLPTSACSSKAMAQLDKITIG